MKLALIGYGKMGREIARIASERGHQIGLIITKTNKNEISEIKSTEVAVEFTNPDAAVDNIFACVKAGIPVISGTTGWSQKIKEVEAFVKENNGSLIHASNFSLGVNIFLELNRKLASLMKGFPAYKISMEEIHHTKKLDAPSGTAISLANDILGIHPYYKNWIKQDDQNNGSNGDAGIPISSVREGNVPGTHVVKYDSPIDSIEIKHTAHNRSGFALGAVIAAEWIKGKKGVYTMRDVLGI